MAEDNNNMQPDVLSALVAEIRSLREESSRRNTQFEERFIALELQQHQQARSSELLEPTPSVTPAVPIEDTRVVATHNPHPTKRPKLRDIPKFGGDKAQWRSWKLETEGKLRVDKEALGDAEGHFMYIFMSLEGKAKDNVTTFVEMQTEKKTFNVAELLNRLELLEIANANAEYWPDDSKISYLQEALNDKMKAALIGSDPSAISSYVGLARRCDSLSSQMELLGQWKRPRGNTKSSDNYDNHQNHGGQAAQKQSGQKTEVRREDMMEWEPTLQASAKVNATRTRSDKNTYGYQSKRPEDQALLGKRAKWVDQAEMDARYHVRVNGTDFVPSLVDYGCLCYGAVSKRTFHSLQLPHIRVQPRILENAAGDGKEVKIDKITYVSIDLDGHQQHRVFMYVIDDLNWDMILGKRWMEDQDVHIHAKEGYLEIGSNGVQLPPQYHKWSRAFSQQLADQLPPHRPALPWGPLYSMSREELLVLRKTLTELLDKGFIRVSSSPAAAPVLMRDRYPLPLLSETLRTIAKARWFTKDYLDDFVSAYIDDVLIFSSGSLQDHRDKVGKVLQRLMDAGLQLDINKSEFEVKAVKYLGFIIEAECGIRVDPEKVEAVKGWATPTNIKSDVPFRWDGLCEEAFEKLKDLLITAPILAHFHPERETIVEADASGFASGGKHSAAEANYAIHDKELLAILRCLEQWEPELRAVEHFKILTDHKNLRYFYSERRLTERQVRWSEFLSKFQFKLEWRPGRKGGLPDALSRRDQDMPKDPNIDIVYQHRGAQEINFGKEIRIFEDEELQQLWHAARQEDKLYQELTKQ
ncbi:reverse transcriptase (RNA-dependent DNA polymerase) [Hirsutella rhossiliensis]|uniref:RNA-directed DNA polymerase n=1 Tax=Hirsutella rhossiliensis TaxID=111463 RepID=A0A9P8MTS1_9HYPO|nr:reverse transcriptase (RNA-dependent DNA polymerase) domain-containing protein [Hirsutella rhossiliensis]KAH0961993.1 reverse transcriptase (RNA-dependent DNA polymerase) domain-containing protein [Hirsutella rhossiliensis]